MKKQMSSAELDYITYVENNVDILTIGGSFYNLKSQAVRDFRLSRAQKEAIVCFISTAEDSYQYWRDNAAEWEKQQPENGPISMRISLRWKNILFADAFWGWTGMIGSGLNPIVGGGAAAAASAISAFN